MVVSFNAQNKMHKIMFDFCCFLPIIEMAKAFFAFFSHFSDIHFCTDA